MFEVAELGLKVSKEEFEKQKEVLRVALLDLQSQLKAANVPLVIVVGGVDGAGKGETVNTLMQWFDPRGIAVETLSSPTDEERERPPIWQFWRRLPPRGGIAIFLGSWYTAPILDRVLSSSRPRVLDRQIQDVLSFERMLTDDGVLLVKLWMHLSRAAQKKRLNKLESKRATSWRVTKEDWRRFRKYRRFYRVSEDVLRRTVTGAAPWHVIEATDRRHQLLSVARTLRTAMERRLVESRLAPALPAVVTPLPAEQRSVLTTLDYSLRVEPEAYKEELEALCGRLSRAARKFTARRRSAVVVFEGPDAAGKGGAIRRLTAAMDARIYRVIPIAAPSQEERARPYMWRFWNQLPRAGSISIFDRSWYGRVLVEPAEGFCSQQEWERAYAEINDFEDHLTRHGTTVVKFWLAITKDEQLRRFQEREKVSFKQFKITPEDWRNREKWDRYDALVHLMVERTSTTVARWTLVEANDKLHARLKVIRVMCERLEEAA